MLHPSYDAPLPLHYVQAQASVYGLDPLHFRRRTTRPVSYYALFKCMAAVSQTQYTQKDAHRSERLFHFIPFSF